MLNEDTFDFEMKKSLNIIAVVIEFIPCHLNLRLI